LTDVNSGLPMGDAGPWLAHMLYHWESTVDSGNISGMKLDT